MKTNIVSILFALVYILCIFLAIPCLIASIYRVYYNHKINEALQSGIQKKHFSPSQLFFSVLSIEIVMMIVLAIMGSFNDNTVQPIYSCKGDIHPIDEIEDTIFENYNGRDIKGYNLASYNEEDFDYLIYHNEEGTYETLPTVVKVNYTNNEDIVYYYGAISYESGEVNAGYQRCDENISKEYVFGIDCDYSYQVTIQLYLFNQEDYNQYLANVNSSDELIMEKNQKYATSYIEIYL